MPLDRRPLRDDIYREISERILHGELAPGSRVRDAMMASALGVSRTPVREALLRLVRDGLLESDVGRGFTVPPLTSVEITDLAEIISALECLAVRLSEVIPDARLRHLDELNETLAASAAPAAAVPLDAEWHRVLLEGCRNQPLRSTLITASDAMRRYTLAFLRDGGRPVFSTDAHANVTAALRLGDRAGAEAALTAHWRGERQELVRWLDGSGRDGIVPL